MCTRPAKSWRKWDYVPIQIPYMDPLNDDPWEETGKSKKIDVHEPEKKPVVVYDAQGQAWTEEKTIGFK